MKIDQLKRVLDGLGIGPSIVQFNGLPNEAYVIEPHNDGWRVFYSERGGRSEERNGIQERATQLMSFGNVLLQIRGLESLTVDVLVTSHRRRGTSRERSMLVNGDPET